MKRGGKTFICLLGGIALTMGARAITSDPTSAKHGESASSNASASSNTGDTPYSAIVDRNVFDLKDPPPPPKDLPPTNAPPPNVTLTGIMSMFGKKQALFMVQKTASPGKAPDAAASYIMCEGQRQEGLEVLEIDQKGAKVKIKNDGIVSTLTFEAAKPGPGGGAMNPPPHMGRGGFNPNYNPNAAPNAPMPTRPMRPPEMSQFSPQGAYNPAAMNQGGISAVGYGQGQPQQTGLSAEAQVAMSLAQQQQHAAEISQGKYPALPPIGGINMSPGADSGQQTPANENQNPQQKLPAWLQGRSTGSFGGGRGPMPQVPPTP
ncbi:MAG TPA: hypothetical protein VFC07_13760 [Verrucomicrobiae bacterium]|nr:hypothetical protein [Verrucomicrobiae bacterium]